MEENQKLVVKMLTGRDIEVEVKKSGNIQDVKEYIYKNTGWCDGRVLYNVPINMIKV